MSTRIRRPSRTGRLPALGLAMTIFIAGIVYVAYNANRSLPLQSRYSITVNVPNADKLAATNDVRIAGIRVGQVAKVDAITPAGGGAPYARAELKLKRSDAPLPADTRVKVRPASILGTTYVDLEPGTGSQMVPDGGALPLSHAQSTVDLTDLLDVFDRSTARATQQALTSLGEGLAGRGSALNSSLGSLNRLLPPVGRVSATLAAPDTRLPASIDGYDAFVRALAPVSNPLSGLLRGGAQTFGALRDAGSALGNTIDAASPAERATTSGLTRLQPALDRLSTLVTDLRAPVALLPTALRRGSAAVTAGVSPLRALPTLADHLGGTLTSLGSLSRDPATSGALRKLREMSDSALVTLNALTPAQVQCNVISLFAQSFGTAYGSVGFGQGPPMAFIGEKHLGSVGESLQNPAPSSGMAINVNPHENYQECESGNEPYPYGSLPVFNGPGKPILGNPPGLQSNHTLDSYPPEGVHALAAAAHLLPTMPAGEKLP